MTFLSAFLLFLFVINAAAKNIRINSAAIELTKEQEEQFHADQRNPNATLFGANHNFTDIGQEILEQAFQHNKYLKAAVGFRWDGSEILCNCTSKFCGDPAVLEILSEINLTNVCLGLACYAQKRIFLDDATGETNYDTHMGCYGGDVETHEHHDHWEDFFCADTPYVNTRCCQTSFCANADFPYPASNFKTISGWVWTFILIGLVLMSFFIIGLIYKGKRWLPRCIEKVLKAKRGGSDVAIPMMDLTGNRFSAPIFPRAYAPLVDESGGNTASTSLDSESSDGHPLNRLLRDLDDSQSCAAWTSGYGGEIVQKSGFLGPIMINEPIGQGRYGRVVKAVWKGQIVAMKVITTYNEQSYYREITMYRAGLLRHTNILQFLGNEPMDNGSGIENCILFEYHQLGSLDNYLSQNTVDVSTATRMIYSMASGLSFLHHATDASGKGSGKPAIAHRDIKSANILVKQNLMTCISDLGLAVCQMEGTIGIPKASITQHDHFEMEQRAITERFEKCGTIRYLCPELLDNSFDFDLFEAYKAADVYALGLVVYETCRRTRIEGSEIIPYEMAQPYFREIALNGGKPGEVDSELMKKIVVDKECRPEASSWWDKHPVMNEIHAVMNECWYLDPSARLTANNVIRKLERIAKRGQIDLTQT